MSQLADASEAEELLGILRNLGIDRQRLVRELADIRSQVSRLVPQVHALGARQADIVRATGYTRETVRQMCFLADMAEAFREHRRKSQMFA
jgi:hypothetical protein